jgi:hypothetical protein
MWLAISSIVLAAAIGFNVLALWLTDWFKRNQPEFLSNPERTTKSDLSPSWASPIGPLTARIVRGGSGGRYRTFSKQFDSKDFTSTPFGEEGVGPDEIVV